MAAVRSDSPTLNTISANGLELAVWDWPGESPALVFAHATGFHARCWDQIVRRFPGRRSLAIDFRGHGRSSKPEPPYRWPEFACDLAYVTAQLNICDAIAIGHSMGGHSVVAAALLRPTTFAALLLLDPTIFQPEVYSLPPFDASFILKRRNRWRSPQEMFERFRTRPPFADWQPEILRDYCEYGLLPGGGKLVLACPPAVEASIYPNSQAPESNLHPALASVEQPVVVVRCGVPWDQHALQLSASPTDPGLASKFPRGRDVLLTGRDHFIPMHSPDLVVDEIERLLFGVR